MPRLRFGFWVDVVCGSLGLALAIVTVFVPDWIEVVSGVDPDRGDGLAEWALSEFFSWARRGSRSPRGVNGVTRILAD